jgi:amidase
VHVGRTAAEIAADVRAGRARAVEVVGEHLDRIGEADPGLGAFQLVRSESALAEAAVVDGLADRPGLALAGVPVAVKDNIAVTGEPMRVGSRASPAGLQTRDHLVVARLQAAGAVVVWVTRMPELAIWAFTDGGFGMARNPWDVSRTCGGSSGGSAAAVAAALVPLAHGNDGLGAIRVPAAACGLVGIKPGFGVAPAELGGDNWSSMGENGPIATTVADAALGLSVMAADPALARVDQPPGRVRIALVTGAPVPGSRVDRHWAGAARDVADLLAGQGHQVQQVQLPVPVWAWRALHARWFAGAEDGAAAAGLDRPAMEARTRRHARAGRIARRLGWVRLEDTGRWREVLAPFFARHDVVLGPALAAPPVPAISWAQRGWWRRITGRAPATPAPSPGRGTWRAGRR